MWSRDEGVKKRDRTSYGRLRVVREARTRVKRALLEKSQSPKKVSSTEFTEFLKL